MGENANQGKLAIMIISYLVVFGLGAAGGYFVTGYSKTSTGTNANGVADRTANGFGGGNFGSGQRPAGGFGGRTAGSVTAVNGDTITVQMQNGTTRTVTLSDSTTYKQTATSSQDKVVVGANIMVSGTADSDGNVAATTVTIQ